MSDEHKENFSDEEHNCDENPHVGNSTTNSDNTAPVQYNSLEIPEYNLQDNGAESTEAMPNDVAIVEELSHEPEDKSSNESSECKVSYEFPSDYEKNENVGHFSQDCDGSTNSIPSHKSPQVSNCSKYSSAFQINKNQDDKVIYTNPLNKKTTDVENTAGTSGGGERKRKKVATTSMQSKRYREVEIPGKNLNQFPRQSEGTQKVGFTDYFSDEFADTEDNVKSSSYFENIESNFWNKTEKRIPLQDLAADIQQRKGRKIDSTDVSKSLKADLSCSSSSDSENSKSVNKASKTTDFFSSLKGETIPAIKLSNEAKKKFELSMETILEVPESESDEQVYQPMQSKTNPLKMKTNVGKRANKCNKCNVRLGLCAIKCRCGGYYCAKHRYDKEHNCTFDYKSMGAAEIEKNNPRVVAEKVRKL